MRTALVKDSKGEHKIFRYDDYTSQKEFVNDLRGNGYRVIKFTENVEAVIREEEGLATSLEELIQHFDFGGVRVIEHNGEAFFVGRDVATALGYSKLADAVREHVPDKFKGIREMEPPVANRMSLSLVKQGCISWSCVASCLRRLSSRIGFARMYCRVFARQAVTLYQVNRRSRRGLQKVGLLVRVAEHKVVPQVNNFVC